MFFVAANYGILDYDSILLFCFFSPEQDKLKVANLHHVPFSVFEESLRAKMEFVSGIDAPKQGAYNRRLDGRLTEKSTLTLALDWAGDTACEVLKL